MEQSKQKEILLLNLSLLLLAVICLVVAVWTAISNMLRAGTDDLFLILVALMLALLFAINPLVWAYENGYLRNPLKGRKEAGAGAAAKNEEKAAAR